MADYLDKPYMDARTFESYRFMVVHKFHDDMLTARMMENEAHYWLIDNMGDRWSYYLTTRKNEWEFYFDSQTDVMGFKLRWL